MRHTRLAGEVVESIHTKRQKVMKILFADDAGAFTKKVLTFWVGNKNLLSPANEQSQLTDLAARDDLAATGTTR